MHPHKEGTTVIEPVVKEVVQSNMDEAAHNVRVRAYWFYWIAALSLINTFLAMKGVFFVMGLAISQIVDGVVVAVTGEINFFISLFTPLIFAAFGFFASKLNRWAFITGAIVYLLDGLLYLYFEQWMAVVFHILILYKLYQGYKAITEYEEESMKMNQDFVKIKV